VGEDRTVTRRQLLVGMALAGVAGGAGLRVWQLQDEPVSAGVELDPDATAAPRPEPTPTPTPTVAPEATPTPEPTEPVALEEPTEPPEEAPPGPPEPGEPYALAPREVLGEAKLLAAAVAQSLTTYAAGEDLGEVVARSILRPRPGLDPAALAVAAEPLLLAGAGSRGRIVYPQLGGLVREGAGAAASVMVVTEQTLEDGAGARVVTRTLDIRLVASPDGWFLDGLASAGGIEVPRPDALPPEAVAVLDDPRIALPDSARWDIHAGGIDLRLLQKMAAMADLHTYAVACLRNGHPVNVFGTDRRSNHTAGRAVDIWRVGEEPVVSQQPDEATPAWDMNRRLFDRGVVPELGGPWSFDGFGGRSFTNEVHLDHLHVAFYDPRTPASEQPPPPPAP
jgi:hypothetical protein